MSTPILICAGISAVLLIFALANISSHLYSIHIDLCHIHDDLVRFYAKVQLDKMGENPILYFNENPPKKGKQREYWRDQNGFKHWRKKDARKKDA